MKKLLMIAPYFVPRRRVGALRPFKFAVHLKKSKWDVSVITIASSSDENHLTDIEKFLLDGLKIYKVSTPFDRTGSLNRKKKSSQKPHLLSISSWIDRHTPLDTWIYLFRLRYSRIRAFAVHQKPNLIWATGDPWSGLWLGEKLSRELNVPFIADFRDPWTLSGLSLRQRSYLSSKADKKAEGSILNSADKVIFTSRQTEALYKHHYNLKPGKTAVIYNSYNDLFAGNQNTGDKPEIIFEADKLHILFLGSFRRLSPVGPIIDILRTLSNSAPTVLPKTVIHSFGGIDSDEIKKIAEFGFADQFRMHEPVLPEQLDGIISKADLLLVSTAPERNTIIPAKLWDYLASEKPILAVVNNPEIAEILKKTGGGVVFRPDQLKEIIAFLKKMWNMKKKGLPTPVPEINRTERKAFGSEIMTIQLEEILDEVIRNAGK